MYENAYNYDRGKESHLIKNSEWGAVAYLAHSKYGRNGIKVSINNNGETYYTGGAGTAYIGNTNQSTTGNVYGIYDMNGNAGESTAAFNSAHSGNYFTRTSCLNAKGGHFAKTGGASTEYATAYDNNTGTYYNDYTVGEVSHTGDGIHEVYVNSNSGWFNGLSVFVTSNAPFFYRGGRYNDTSTSSVFWSYNTDGFASNSCSFRVVCAF